METCRCTDGAKCMCDVGGGERSGGEWSGGMELGGLNEHLYVRLLYSIILVEGGGHGEIQVPAPLQALDKSI